MNRTLLNQIEQLQAQSLKATIDSLNEKQLWKIRTRRLASHNKQCYFCLSAKDWNPETLICQPCSKEVSHA